MPPQLPPGQQWVAAGKWPNVGERAARSGDESWSVRVDGAASRPCTFTLAELQSWPQTDQIVDIHCVTRWSKSGVRFRGVPLASVLEQARPDPAAQFISFVAHSDRDHSTSLRLADALELHTLLAFSADDAPLDPARGGPLRVIVPGRYFYKSLKWLARIELLAEDRLGFWESTAGYHNTADPWREQRYVACGLSKAEARAILAQRNIAGRELRGLDAGGRDLSGLAAQGALVRDADFRNCDLRGACFDGANLTNAHFQGADLRDASFRGADLEGADFSGANLRGACLAGASLLAASFFESAGPSDPPRRAVLVDDQTRIDAAALEELMPEQQALLRAALGPSGLA